MLEHSGWTITLKKENEEDTLLQSPVISFSLTRENDDYSQIASNIEVTIDNCNLLLNEGTSMLGQKFDITMICEPYEGSKKNILDATLISLTHKQEGTNMHVVANWSYLEDESFPQTVNVDTIQIREVADYYHASNISISNYNFAYQTVYDECFLNPDLDRDQELSWSLLGF